MGFEKAGQRNHGLRPNFALPAGVAAAQDRNPPGLAATAPGRLRGAALYRLDLRQKEVVPAGRTVDVARPTFCGHTVAVAIKHCRLAALPETRRAFGNTLTATAASLPDAANESYWQMVKREYPLEDGLIYLNAANVCPASRLVINRHFEYLRDFHANPSFHNRDKYEAMCE
jgi:hypothetical protein